MRHLKRLSILVSLVMGFALTIAWADTGVKYLSLTVGLTEEVKVPGMPSAVGEDGGYNKGIVKISVAPTLKIIRFEPIAAGTTKFILRGTSGQKVAEYKITVRKNDLGRAAGEIKALLGDIEGITIKIINNKVVVDGEILLPRDMIRIANVINQFTDVASSIVTMSPLAQKKIAELIERDIGNPEIHVRAVNEKFILEGVASSMAEKEKAMVIAQTYLPDGLSEAVEGGGVIKKRKVKSDIVDLLTIKPGPEPQPGKIIKIIVHFVELQKDYNRAFRFQWTPSLKEDSGVTFTSDSSKDEGLISTITGTISDLLPKLNWAKAHGHARILQSSSIIVQDGNTGTIKSKTKVPYTTQNANGQLTTSFAEAGLDTTVIPTIVSAKSDSISMVLKFNIDSLVGQTEKGPLIASKLIDTKIIVRSSQSAAIGGLVSNEASMGYNRLPKGVSDNPIISLYSSKQFQRNQTQFVVFVTPVIMNSASEGAEDVKKKFRLKE